MHYWDDDWPYWDDLYRAQKYFCRFYFRCTKKHPITKEKYGTIRYEFAGIWIEGEKDCFIFREAIRRTVRKFPTVAGEITDDAHHVLNDEYFEGWCAGVTFQSTGSYWSSNKRPNGV